MWHMQCMICDHRDTNLVHIQEHVMNEHGYTVEQLRAQSKRQPEENTYIWTMPDGKDWLKADRVEN